MNMMVVAYGDTAILIDAGVMFPEPELLGVDLIIPDLRQLAQYRIQALVLTHGHEDHIGAVPHVVSHFEGPSFGTELTLALVEPKLADHDAAVRGRLRKIKPRDRVEVGPFTLECLRVTHSMPDCVGVAIHTPVGVVLHTGDCTIDQTPLDAEHLDLQRFAQLDAGYPKLQRSAHLGAEGVLVMLGNSSNVDRKGVSGSRFPGTDGSQVIF